MFDTGVHLLEMLQCPTLPPELCKPLALSAQAVWQVCHDVNRHMQEIKCLTSENQFLREFAKLKFTDVQATMKVPDDIMKLQKWAAECQMKKAANNVYGESSNSQNNFHGRGRGGRGRGRNNGRRGGRNWSWYAPNYNNNNKRPFDAFTQAPDTQQQHKS